jgi:hypothetical protein
MRGSLPRLRIHLEVISPPTRFCLDMVLSSAMSCQSLGIRLGLSWCPRRRICGGSNRELTLRLELVGFQCFPTEAQLFVEALAMDAPSTDPPTHRASAALRGDRHDRRTAITTRRRDEGPGAVGRDRADALEGEPLLELLDEYEKLFFKLYPRMETDDGRWFRLSDYAGKLPLLLTLRAARRPPKLGISGRANGRWVPAVRAACILSTCLESQKTGGRCE